MDNLKKNKINTVLLALVLINVIGDVGNVIFWFASPSSQISLVGGTIGEVTMTGGGTVNQLFGPSVALAVGSTVLLIVALAYLVAVFGLMKEQKWGAMLVIAVSIVNRVAAVFLYQFNEAFYFWVAWTIILIAVATLDYLKLSTKPQSNAPAPAPPPT